jgi:hypothetical protein
MKNYAIFSTSGRFIGFSNFKPENGFYKEMPDNLDPVHQVYVGDYETGGLKSIDEVQIKDYREANLDKKWKVFESEINAETGKLITDELDIPLYKQINAIMETLYLNKDKIQLSEGFTEIYNEIENIRIRHANSLKVYEEAPKADFISKKDERLYIEEYTQNFLNITEEPVIIQKID